MVERFRIEMAQAVAEAWNDHDIDYVVLGGIENYPAAVGRDLDVLVAPHHLDLAVRLASSQLRSMGVMVARVRSPWCEESLVAFPIERSDDGAIGWDFTTKLVWGITELVTAPLPYHLFGPFKSNTGAKFVKKALLPALAYDFSRISYGDFDTQRLDDRHEEITALLQQIFGDRTAEALIEAFSSREHELLRRAVGKARKRLWVQSVLGQPPFVSVQLAVRRLRGFWRLYSEDRTPTVALVGPDGVGKTTTLDRITSEPPRIFTGVERRHWAPRVLPAPGRFLRPKERSERSESSSDVRQPGRTARRRLRRIVDRGRIWYFYADYVIGRVVRDRPRSSRLQLLLYDRCSLDIEVVPNRYGFLTSKGTELFRKVKPDMVILLVDDPEKIVARKAELPVAEIARQYSEWYRLARLGYVDAIVEFKDGQQHITASIARLISEKLLEQHGGAVYPRFNSVEWLRYVLSSQALESFDGSREGRLAPGFSDSTYGVLSLGDGRSFVLPLTPRKVFAKALDLYVAHSWKSRVIKQTIFVGIRLGLGRPLWRLLSMLQIASGNCGLSKSSDLIDHLSSVLGFTELNVAITLGTPGPHQKPTLQLMDNNGQILGYAKIGWNDETNKLLQNEVSVLKHLNESPPRFFRVPGVLYEGFWNGRFIGVQSAADNLKVVKRSRLSRAVTGVVTELAGMATQRVPLRESEFWSSIGERIESIPNLYHRKFAMDIAHTLERYFADEPIPFHFRHGDFSPWHIRLVNGELYVFDWEYADRDGSPAWDLFHFLIQSERLIRKNPPGELLRLITTECETRDLLVEFLDTIGADPDAIVGYYALYLLERLTFCGAVRPDSFRRMRELNIALRLVEQELVRERT